MKILNFFESYHLHDSLLENVEIDEVIMTAESPKLVLSIFFSQMFHRCPLNRIK